ncbi:MAG: ribosome maturation factor RimM, partial [Microbacterium sp.]
AAIVPEVDVPGGRLVVTPPAGLFEELPADDEPDESAADGGPEDESTEG